MVAVVGRSVEVAAGRRAVEAEPDGKGLLELMREMDSAPEELDSGTLHRISFINHNHIVSSDLLLFESVDACVQAMMMYSDGVVLV